MRSTHYPVDSENSFQAISSKVTSFSMSGKPGTGGWGKLPTNICLVPAALRRISNKGLHRKVDELEYPFLDAKLRKQWTSSIDNSTPSKRGKKWPAIYKHQKVRQAEIPAVVKVRCPVEGF